MFYLISASRLLMQDTVMIWSDERKHFSGAYSVTCIVVFFSAERCISCWQVNTGVSAQLQAELQAADARSSGGEHRAAAPTLTASQTAAKAFIYRKNNLIIFSFSLLPGFQNLMVERGAAILAFTSHEFFPVMTSRSGLSS